MELNARYLDALVLLLRAEGRLVSKDRFMAEVWRGVPVTDEALTQCIKTLRRQLGDNAGAPRFIETVPKHGYRFIAPVRCVDSGAPAPAPAAQMSAVWREFALTGGAGMLGGGAAGMIGGLLYGFGGVFQPAGAVSALIVLVLLCMMVGLTGAAGVGFGIAAAGFFAGRSWQWRILGGAGGGLMIGAVVKLLGLDAFNLLFGQTPGDITGAAEGALLGGAVGFGAWFALRGADMRRGIIGAALAGLAAGILITLLGGKLMSGSLYLLAQRFPNSRLRFDHIGALFGESGFGPISQIATAGLEGLLFGGCMVGAMMLARRRAS